MSAEGRHPYLGHWGLAEPPFLLEPDPRFAYERADHQEGLARILFGITQLGGLVLVTGEIGCGKTTLAQALRGTLDAEGWRLAEVANPPRSPAAVLSALLAALGEPAAGGSVARRAERVRAGLTARREEGARPVLLVDEAQRMAPTALEELRLLTNPQEAPLPAAGAGGGREGRRRRRSEPGPPLVLLGQPELGAHVARLPQLGQRVVVRFHIGPMSAEEVDAYAQHRLRVAGARRRILSRRAAAAVHAETGGVPRLVNLLLANALFVAAARGEERIGEDTVRDIAEDREMDGAGADHMTTGEETG